MCMYMNCNPVFHLLRQSPCILLTASWTHLSISNPSQQIVTSGEGATVQDLQRKEREKNTSR